MSFDQRTAELRRELAPPRAQPAPSCRRAASSCASSLASSAARRRCRGATGGAGRCRLRRIGERKLGRQLHRRGGRQSAPGSSEESRDSVHVGSLRYVSATHPRASRHSAPAPACRQLGALLLQRAQARRLSALPARAALSRSSTCAMRSSSPARPPRACRRAPPPARAAGSRASAPAASARCRRRAGGDHRAAVRSDGRHAAAAHRPRIRHPGEAAARTADARRRPRQPGSARRPGALRRPGARARAPLKLAEAVGPRRVVRQRPQQPRERACSCSRSGCMTVGSPAARARRAAARGRAPAAIWKS